MKPRRLRLGRPDSLPALLARLAEAPRAACEADRGGPIAGPMLKPAPGSSPTSSSTYRRAELLAGPHRGGTLVLGACVTHADIEDGRVPDVTGGALQTGRLGHRLPAGAQPGHRRRAASLMRTRRRLGDRAHCARRRGRDRGPPRAPPPARGAVRDRSRSSVALGPAEIVAAVRVPPMPGGRRLGLRQALRQGRRVRPLPSAAVRLEPQAGRGDGRDGRRRGPPVLLADARPLFGGRIDAGVSPPRFDGRAADAICARPGWPTRWSGTSTSRCWPARGRHRTRLTVSRDPPGGRMSAA